LEERAQRTDSSPGALFSEQMRAAIYLAHPYRIPIIGWRHEMQALSIDDARAFYDTYYAPNNAILIVAGDTTPDEVRDLAMRHYGPIPPSDDLPLRERPQDPPHVANRRVILQDDRVANPYVMISYLASNRQMGAQRDAAALFLLAEILGGASQNSILTRDLEIDAQRSLFTGAYYNPTTLDQTTFSLVNMPVPGLSMQQAEDDLRRVIADFLENGIDPDHFERLQFQVAAAQIYAQDDVGTIARAYGAALTSGLTVADQQAWPDVISATTIDDVMRVARDLFETTHDVTGYLMRPDAQAAQGDAQ
jgi:zinc protease